MPFLNSSRQLTSKAQYKYMIVFKVHVYVRCPNVTIPILYYNFKAVSIVPVTGHNNYVIAIDTAEKLRKYLENERKKKSIINGGIQTRDH